MRAEVRKQYTERQGASKNRQPAQRSPLLHHAGIVDQLVEHWTAEHYLALRLVGKRWKRA